MKVLLSSRNVTRTPATSFRCNQWWVVQMIQTIIVLALLLLTILQLLGVMQQQQQQTYLVVEACIVCVQHQFHRASGGVVRALPSFFHHHQHDPQLQQQEQHLYYDVITSHDGRDNNNIHIENHEKRNIRSLPFNLQLPLINMRQSSIYDNKKYEINRHQKQQQHQFSNTHFIITNRPQQQTTISKTRQQGTLNDDDFTVIVPSNSTTTNASKSPAVDTAVENTELNDTNFVSTSAIMIGTIGIYKNFISPLLPPACRFLPTCSTYGVQAIEQYGPIKGCILIAWRLVRCSPIGGKGYDPPIWPPVPYTYSSY